MVGGGVRLGDLVLGLNEKGRALPHGECPPRSVPIIRNLNLARHLRRLPLRR